MIRNKKFGIVLIVAPVILMLASLGYIIAVVFSSSTPLLDLLSKGAENNEFLNILRILILLTGILGVAGLCVGLPLGVHLLRKKV